VTAQIGMIQVMQDMFKMEINKISDTEIEVIETEKRIVTKEELKRQKTRLQKRLLKIDNLLKEFI